jgi:hypothetical protein
MALPSITEDDEKNIKDRERRIQLGELKRGEETPKEPSASGPDGAETTKQMLGVAQEMAAQRMAHEKAKMAGAQSGMKQMADGSQALAGGTQNALDSLMNVYKSAFGR